MSDVTDSNVDLSMLSFERDLVRYMKRSTFEVDPSDKYLSISSSPMFPEWLKKFPL